jgi:hypothetical protein
VPEASTPCPSQSAAQELRHSAAPAFEPPVRDERALLRYGTALSPQREITLDLYRTEPAGRNTAGRPRLKYTSYP